MFTKASRCRPVHLAAEQAHPDAPDNNELQRTRSAQVTAAAALAAELSVRQTCRCRREPLISSSRDSKIAQVQPDPSMHAAFRRRRRRTVLGVLGFVILPLVGGALAIFVQGLPQWLNAAWVIAGVGLFVLAMLSWRCPQCGSFLASTWSPRYCWRCGVRLS